MFQPHSFATVLHAETACSRIREEVAVSVVSSVIARSSVQVVVRFAIDSATADLHHDPRRDRNHHECPSPIDGSRRRDVQTLLSAPAYMTFLCRAPFSPLASLSPLGQIAGQSTGGSTMLDVLLMVGAVAGFAAAIGYGFVCERL